MQGYIDVLKMDCEGCEYALARDVLAEDPEFFTRVGQFVVEIHTDSRFLRDNNHALALGRLAVLLERAGLRLAGGHITGCAVPSAPTETEPCHPLLLEAGYLCGRGRNCQNWWFARIQPTVNV